MLRVKLVKSGSQDALSQADNHEGVMSRLASLRVFSPKSSVDKSQLPDLSSN
jgi:hypothetical protein